MTQFNQFALKEKQINEMLENIQQHYSNLVILVRKGKTYIHFKGQNKPEWAANIMEVLPNRLKSISAKQRKLLAS